MWPKLFFVLYTVLGWLALPWLCLYPKARRHILKLPAPSPGCIWVHGASAGENQAARALCKALKEPYWRTFSSWRTPIPDAFPAPLDLPVIRERWLDRARPKLLILIEAELWPGWIEACRKRQIPIVVVNAKASQSPRRWKKRGLWSWLTADISFIPIQDVGDLKTAAPPSEPTFTIDRPYILAASTHASDEMALIESWSLLPERPLLILAPRRIDRAADIIQKHRPYTIQCRSALPLEDETEILILDSYGELAALYNKATCAFIGGTFDPSIGGHSPAEAIAAGCPYVYGPHHQSNSESFTQGRGFQVTHKTELFKALQMAMTAQAKPSQADTQAIIERLPKGQTPPETAARPWLKPLIPLWVKWGSRQPSYAGKAEKAPIPIISVGGLSAGGTGKTPICAWLAHQSEGLWISSRGYRRPSQGPLLRVDELLGDEAELLKRRGLKVISCPDRLMAAHYAAEQGAKALIIDDGFQHRRISRQLNICCIDMHWPTARGQIPVGWAREAWVAHERANILWLHNFHPELPCPPMNNRPKIRSRLKPSHWLHQGQAYPLNHIQGPVAVAVGIAHPEAFLTTLHQLKISMAQIIQVPDHHPLPKLPKGCVLTEKDAARLPPEADVWALCMRLEIDNPTFIQDQIELCLSPHAF